MSEQQPIDPKEVGKIWDFIGFDGKKPSGGQQAGQPQQQQQQGQTGSAPQPNQPEPTTNGAKNMEGSSSEPSTGGLRNRRAATPGGPGQPKPSTGAPSGPSSSSSASAASAAAAGFPPPAPVQTGPPKTFRQKFFSFAPLPWWSLLIFICFFFSEVRWRLNESPCGILGLPDPVNSSQIKRAFRTISL